MWPECPSAKVAVAFSALPRSSECYHQKKRRINEPANQMFSRGIAMRDIAAVMRASRTTI